MPNKEVFVLDTSAIFCLKDNEPGAARVEAVLNEARRGRCQLLVSFASMMEYLYICLIRDGEEAAYQSYAQLSLLPLSVVESNEEYRIKAATMKAVHQVSFADAWVAATAVIFDGVLLHKDPEFESLAKVVKCEALPYKVKAHK